MKRLTPVIFVEEIEPCLDFWVQLGFECGIEVPDGDKLGFVAMRRGGVEVMYQSRASVEKDLPDLLNGTLDKSGALFVEVEDLDDVKNSIDSETVVVPERTTFYGAREFFVRAPCGTVVGFAEFKK